MPITFQRTVEATPVTIEGREFMLIDRDVFEAVFGKNPETVLAVHEPKTGSRVTAVKQKKPPAPKRAASNRPAPTRDAVLRAVEEEPRTTGALIDRVIDFIPTTTRLSVDATIRMLAAKKAIEKRDLPHDVPKWFLTGAAQ